MAPSQSDVASNRNIKHFFKPFTGPKNRCPASESPGDEIVVTTSRKYHDVNSLDGSADVSTAQDDPFPSLSPTSPSRQTPMLAVLIPSSNPKTAQHSPSSPPRPSNQPTVSVPTAKAANASFTSTSSLSSVPVSSQSFSKRIIKDGLQAVTNSDSNDEDEDDSEDELADASSFLVNKRRKLTPPAERRITCPSADLAKSGRESSRRPGKESRRESLSNLPASPPQKVYRHSLAKIVAQNQRWKNAEAKIADLETSISEAIKREGEILARQDDVNREAMAAAMESDSDERERMVQALVRVEAFQEEDRFYFSIGPAPLHESSPFPEASLDTRVWRRVLKNEETRIQACTCGFVTELAAKYPLPADLTRWMAEQLAHEQSEVLCESYVRILRASIFNTDSKCHHLATLSRFYKTRSLAESGQKGQPLLGLPPGLSCIIRVVSSAAPVTDNLTKSESTTKTAETFLDLAMLAIDERVRDDPSISRILADRIEEMLDILSEESYAQLVSKVIPKLFQGEDLTPQLRCRLICALPAGTHRSYQIRRRLALECVSHSPSRDPQDWSRSIVQSLKSKPEFFISTSTDYRLLLSLTFVLDVAIADGFSSDPEIFSTLPSITTGPFAPSAPVSDAEKRHNHQIDAITARLRFMASRIRDAGTSHLRRTEAKSAIERLIARLDYSVRTRPKPKKGVFDGFAKTNAMYVNPQSAKGGAAVAEMEQREMSNVSFQLLDELTRQSGDAEDRLQDDDDS